MEDIVISRREYDMLKETEGQYRAIMRWLENKASISNYDKTGITIDAYSITDFLKVVCPDNFYAIKAACKRKEGEKKERREK